MSTVVALRDSRLVACARLLMFAVVLPSTALPLVFGGPWLAGPDLSAPRAGAAATALMDGRVLVSGGAGLDGTLDSVDMLVDGVAVLPAAPLNIGRRDHVCVLLNDGRVLVAGGTTSEGAPTATAELYDPSTNSWTLTQPMAQARSGAAAVLLGDGRVLVAAGEGDDGALATLELFQPAFDTFSQSAAVLSSPRTDLAAARLGTGRVLITGGSDGSALLATTEVYIPTTDTIVPGPALDGPRAGHSATTLMDGSILVAGGRDAGGDLATALVCDAQAAAFFPTLSALATPRSGHLAVALPGNEAVLIAGGASSGIALSSVELFRPWSGTFVPAAPMSAARVQAAATPMRADGLLVVAGGEGEASTDLFGFATLRTDKFDYSPGETVTISGVGWEPGETVSLRLSEVPAINPDIELTAVADASGGILNMEFAPEHHHIGVMFCLVARGSSWEAATMFMDSPKVGSVTLGAQGGAATYGTAGTATYTVTVQRGSGPGSAGAFTANLSVTSSLPTGATASFSPNPVSFAPSTSSATSMLTISTGACQPAGNTAITVRAATSTQDFATTGGTLAVAQRPITIGVDPKSRPYGDANPALTAQVGGSGLAAACGDTLADVGSFSTTAGPCSGVGLYPIQFTASGPKAANYAVTSAGAQLTVSARSLALAADAQSRTYGDANPTLTAQVVGGSLAAACGDTLADVGALSTAATPCSDVGSYAIAFATTGPKAGNYAVNYSPANLTVLARSLTVSADGHSRLYGDANPALTAQFGGSGLAVGCGDELADVGTLSTAATQCSDVGSYPIAFAANGPKAGNYAVTSFDADLTVLPRPLSVTADAQSRTYGNANPALTAQLGGSGLAVDCGDTLADVGSLSTAATQCSDVGSHAIGFASDGPKAGNYAVSFAGADFTILARALTVAIDAQSRSYGDANAALTAQLGGDGLAEDCGDTLADVGTLATTATQCSDVGSYAITFATGGSKAGNYAVTTSGADITVQARPLTVTADAQSRLYGDANPALTAQLGGSGLAVDCGDTLADIGSLSTAATQCSDVGSYAISFSANGLKAGNYALTSAYADLTVLARPLAVTVDAQSRPYGDANPALTAQIGGSGLAVDCGDTLADVGSLSTAATQCTDVGSYAIVFAANGPKAGNYAITLTAANLTVLARPLAVSANAQGRLYGDGNPVLTAQIGGGGLAAACGDTLADVGALTTAATPCSGVGDYAIVFAATGPKAGNYAVTFTGANLTILRRSLVIRADDRSMVLAAPLPSFSAQYTGFACSDTAASLDAPVVFSPSAAPLAVGSFPIVPSGAADANYEITFVNGTLQVLYAGTGGPCGNGLGHSILQPINTDGSSVFKRGSSVPAKFRVFDANCNSIGTPGVVTSFVLYQVTSGTAVSSANEAVDSTTPTNQFVWDQNDKQWHFVISTKGATYQAGKTYHYRVTLDDGSTIQFQFGLK